MKSAIEQLEELEKQHQDKIANIKASAVTEITKRINELNEEKAKLAEQYKKLTGKDLKGNPVAKSSGGGERVRLSDEESEELITKIKKLLTGSKGLKMSEILKECETDRINDKHIKARIKALENLVKKGNKTDMTYSL